jgi:hypothetical protein
MLSGLWTLIANFFGFGKAVAEEVKQRDAENNTPAMKAAATSAEDQAEADKLSEDIASGNLNRIRKDEADSQTPSAR